MTMRERIHQGKLFTDMCEGLPEERTRAKRLQYQFNSSDPEDTQTRMQLLEQIFGQRVHAWIEPPFYFCYGSNIKLSGSCYINTGCTFLDDGEILIGDRVLFGPGVSIATVGHPVLPDLRGYMYCDPVHIGAGCWIGAGAIICPGVSIGENTVIGAGSVVTKDIPANVVAVGNPCRVLRPISEHDARYYYKDRPITQEDLDEERALRGG